MSRLDREFHFRVTNGEVGRVSPFGHRRIKASRQLPDDYRSHARPSSVVGTKTSTVCVSKDFVFKKLTFQKEFVSRKTAARGAKHSQTKCFSFRARPSR